MFRKKKVEPTNTEDAIKNVLKIIMGEQEKGLGRLIAELKNALQDGKDITRIKKELENLKLSKEIAERDIKHLVKMKEEKMEVEFQKKSLKLDRDFTKKEMELQQSYHEKILATLAKHKDESMTMYKEILKRLPNVNMKITKEG